ncbi:uncharacterized protein LOC144818635 [Lissotriton helveticus]
MAMVLSRLDYGNIIYNGAPAYAIHRLQLVQNQAACLIHGLPKFHRVTPLLQALHWLPVKERALFKLGCTTFQAKMGTAPEFICSAIKPYTPGRELRSTYQALLTTPRFRKKKAGGTKFAVLAPAFWNSLPTELRMTPSYIEFRKGLNTLLFSQAYNV